MCGEALTIVSYQVETSFTECISINLFGVLVLIYLVHLLYQRVPFVGTISCSGFDSNFAALL